MPKLTDNKRLGTIFNNDINNILCALDPNKPVGEIEVDYRRALAQILEAKPGVFAQNVGMPDTVIYDTEVATTWDKYFVEIAESLWPGERNFADEAGAYAKLAQAGADPFTITIDECRKRGIPILADYRMNAEDFYGETYRLNDFGRAHPEWRIPLPEKLKQIIKRDGGDPPDYTGALDPAVPEVFDHRMRIFREVAERYDVDGIEFDFRRWTHMISDPLGNNPILTRMVAETRQMLNEVAVEKGRERLLLGVRVGPSLDTPEDVAKYPGADPGADPSCKELGLDVKTWIDKEYVDFVCPTLFWPRWPGHPHTGEFVDLAKGKNVGIYPTLFPLPEWLEPDNEQGKGPMEPGDPRLEAYRKGFCDIALKMYEDGADGISTFNWYFHLHLANSPNQWQAYYGYGMGGAAVQKQMLSILGDPKAIRHYLKQPWALPTKSIRCNS